MLATVQGPDQAQGVSGLSPASQLGAAPRALPSLLAANVAPPGCCMPACSLVLPLWLSLLDKCAHAFLLVIQGKARPARHEQRRQYSVSLAGTSGDQGRHRRRPGLLWLAAPLP